MVPSNQAICPLSYPGLVGAPVPQEVLMQQPIVVDEDGDIIMVRT